jgi:hypothetical protein
MVLTMCFRRRVSLQKSLVQISFKTQDGDTNQKNMQCCRVVSLYVFLAQYNFNFSEYLKFAVKSIVPTCINR